MTVREALIKYATLRPYEHQVEGVHALLRAPFFLVADEMGAGKTKQVIDAVQVLFHQNKVDRVIVICPSSVRSVWYDMELGEIAKHTWSRTPTQVSMFRQKIRQWKSSEPPGEEPRRLKWIITNYDFIRAGKASNGKKRLATLLTYCGPRTVLVLDESSAVKSYKAQQTKSCMKLREKCGRVVLLNGTPLTQGIGDLFSQANLMSPRIFGVKSYFHFRSRYAVMGGWQGRQVIGWRDIDDIQKRLAPYVIRRLKKDCLDLPAKLPSVLITAELDSKTWQMYKEMREDLVAWLQGPYASIAAQAAVKAMRLQQITSGFLGGVREQQIDAEGMPVEESEGPRASAIEWISTEKQDTLLEQMELWLEEDPHFKIVIWSRFRAEIARTVDNLRARFKGVDVGQIIGGQKESERDDAKRLLDPRSAPAGPVVVVANPASGGMGLQLTAASNNLYLSNSGSLKDRLQSEDRTHRPGQIRAVNYFDMIAVGPNGQRTIDHTIFKRLQGKEELATLTASAWVKELMEE